MPYKYKPYAARQWLIDPDSRVNVCNTCQSLFDTRDKHETNHNSGTEENRKNQWRIQGVFSGDNPFPISLLSPFHFPVSPFSSLPFSLFSHLFALPATKRPPIAAIALELLQRVLAKPVRRTLFDAFQALYMGNNIIFYRNSPAEIVNTGNEVIDCLVQSVSSLCFHKEQAV